MISSVPGEYREGRELGCLHEFTQRAPSTNETGLLAYVYYCFVLIIHTKEGKEPEEKKKLSS